MLGFMRVLEESYKGSIRVLQGLYTGSARVVYRAFSLRVLQVLRFGF